MVTCRPDISFATVKLAQFSACPSEKHYHALRHCLKYLVHTKNDGIYYWRPTPRLDLDIGPTPQVSSNSHDLDFDNRPTIDPAVVTGMTDSDWATCPITRRSFTGICFMLAGGCISYKTRLQKTPAMSSTEAEFMAASDAGKMSLFLRSLLHDLHIPQNAATVLFEDNEGAIGMAMAQKPTTRTRHMDIHYFAIVDWVEGDLINLEYIHTSKNLADNFTKPLDKIAFHRNVDFILGHIPPKHAPFTKRRLGPTPTLPVPTRSSLKSRPNIVVPRAAKLDHGDPWCSYRLSAAAA